MVAAVADSPLAEHALAAVPVRLVTRAAGVVAAAREVAVHAAAEVTVVVVVEVAVTQGKERQVSPLQAHRVQAISAIRHWSCHLPLRR